MPATSVATGQQLAGIAGEGQRDAEVLQVQRQAAGGREVPVDHVGRPVAQHPRRRRALLDGGDDGRRVEARGLGHGDALGDAEVVAGQHHLVHRLGHLAGAGRAEVLDAAAEVLQHGPGPGDGIARTAAEQGERAVGRALDPARHGRVDEVDRAAPRTPRPSPPAVAGCTVDVSTTTVPGRAEASTPSSPSTTSRTAASSLTASTTTSARRGGFGRCGRHRGTHARRARSTWPATGSTPRPHPPAATSRVAIRPPMLPRPRTAQGGGTGPVDRGLSLIEPSAAIVAVDVAAPLGGHRLDHHVVGTGAGVGGEPVEHGGWRRRRPAGRRPSGR